MVNEVVKVPSPAPARPKRARKKVTPFQFTPTQSERLPRR